MEDETLAAAPRPPRRAAASPTRAAGALSAVVGIVVGVVLGLILAGLIDDNPFSDANEVIYREITVRSVTANADAICWSAEPTRRDAPQECAILSLDPASNVPREGDRVVVGVVDLRAPDGVTAKQVIFAGQLGAAPGAPAATPPTDAASPSPSPTST